MSQIKELFKDLAVRAAEQVLLPAEELLCQRILSKPEAQRILSQPDVKVLIIGTDRRALLACEFNARFPEAAITVVDRNTETVAAAKRNARGTGAQFLTRDIFAIQPSELPPQSMAVAKHLLHLVDGPELAAHVDTLLRPNGVFYASVPPLCARKPKRESTQAGIGFETESLGRGPKGGTLFTFRSKD